MWIKKSRKWKLSHHHSSCNRHNYKNNSSSDLEIVTCHLFFFRKTQQNIHYDMRHNNVIFFEKKNTFKQKYQKNYLHRPKFKHFSAYMSRFAFVDAFLFFIKKVTVLCGARLIWMLNDRPTLFRVSFYHALKSFVWIFLDKLRCFMGLHKNFIEIFL